MALKRLLWYQSYGMRWIDLFSDIPMPFYIIGFGRVYTYVMFYYRFQDEFWTDPNRSISKAYERTDQAILSHNPDLGRGGSTAVTAILIDSRKLWIANVGDSRAVLSKRGQAIQMTTDHEPNTERSSIEDRGGFVSNMPGSFTYPQALHVYVWVGGWVGVGTCLCVSMCTCACVSHLTFKLEVFLDWLLVEITVTLVFPN